MHGSCSSRQHVRTTVLRLGNTSRSILQHMLKVLASSVSAASRETSKMWWLVALLRRLSQCRRPARLCFGLLFRAAAPGSLYHVTSLALLLSSSSSQPSSASHFSHRPDYRLISAQATGHQRCSHIHSHALVPSSARLAHPLVTSFGRLRSKVPSARRGRQLSYIPSSHVARVRANTGEPLSQNNTSENGHEVLLEMRVLVVV